MFPVGSSGLFIMAEKAEERDTAIGIEEGGCFGMEKERYLADPRFQGMEPFEIDTFVKKELYREISKYCKMRWIVNEKFKKSRKLH